MQTRLIPMSTENGSYSPGPHPDRRTLPCQVFSGEILDRHRPGTTFTDPPC